MAIKLSPEYWVGGLIKSATNGRIISARLRRILTIILISIWALSITQIIMSILDIKRELNAYNKNPHTYPEYILKHNLKEPIEIIIYVVLFMILPWLIIRLVFWVIDADKAKG